MAVYTQVQENELQLLLKNYPIGEMVAIKGITEGVENSNFLLTTTSGRFILTIYEKRARVESLPFYLNLMQELSAHGILCPQPICDNNGTALQTISGKPAAMVSFLEGKSLRTAIDDNHVEVLGTGLARMHLAAQNLEREAPENHYSLSCWREMANNLLPRADEVKPGMGKEIATHLAWIEENWPEGLPTGVIHADLFPDNVFFHEGKLSGFIDFYFACRDALMYDVAIVLNAWCFDHGRDFNLTKAKKFLSAYHAVRPLSKTEQEALPVLASGAALRFLLTRLHDWLHRVEGAMVTPKDPREYLHKLRFHHGLSSYKEYGL